MSPIRMCIEAGCPNVVKAGRCAEHRKTLERDRSRVRREEGRDRNRLYASKRWAITRRHKLFLTPLCELEHPGCLGIANEVHHRVALEHGGEVFALDNLISSCKPCHSRETLREQRERRP